MLSPKLKPYLKKLTYSYCFGAYPTLDLFKYQPDKAIKVLLHNDGKESDGFTDVIAACESANIPYEFNDQAISKIAHKENTYVIGIFTKYESELESGENHLLLDQVRNMGNLGAIMRTMVGLGVNNLAIIRPSADIFDPKVVRSAMGALFQIRFSYFDNIADYMAKHSKRNLYTLRLDGAKALSETEFIKPYSIIMGNESRGLGDEYKEIGQGVSIKHSEDIDSLNLSIATAITLWEAQKGS